MNRYPRNKFKTAVDIVRRIKNWPTAFDLRLRQKNPGERILHFRDGLNVVCRGATRDWDVVHELLFARSYDRAMNFLKSSPANSIVLDLGGNIGLFSLLAATANFGSQIHAYEPGPPNIQIFEKNLAANPALAGRIHLHREAVGGNTRAVEWFFDSSNPGGSGLFTTNGEKFSVQIHALAEVVHALPGRVRLAKIDIEGAEFELLAETPAEIWQRIDAVSLELHDDPDKKFSQPEFLKRMESLGFTIEEESVCSYFLHR